jgi:hypothetical protein
MAPLGTDHQGVDIFAGVNADHGGRLQRFLAALEGLVDRYWGGVADGGLRPARSRM